MSKFSKILPVLAIVVGLAGSAFTAIKKHQNDAEQTYFWYDANNGSSLGQGELPSNGCDAPGDDCALGFITPQSDPLNSPPDATVAEDE